MPLLPNTNASSKVGMLKQVRLLDVIIEAQAVVNTCMSAAIFVSSSCNCWSISVVMVSVDALFIRRFWVFKAWHPPTGWFYGEFVNIRSRMAEYSEDVGG